MRDQELPGGHFGRCALRSGAGDPVDRSDEVVCPVCRAVAGWTLRGAAAALWDLAAEPPAAAAA